MTKMALKWYCYPGGKVLKVETSVEEIKIRIRVRLLDH
jgi:hypothetical protein